MGLYVADSAVKRVLEGENSDVGYITTDKNAIFPEASEEDYSFSYTGADQHWTAPFSGKLTIECKGAGSNNANGGYAKGTISITKGQKFSIMVGGYGGRTNDGTTYGFGGSTTYGGRGGGGLSGVFTGEETITDSQASRVVIIAGGAGGGRTGGGAGGGESGQNGNGGSYGFPGGGGTQTAKGSGNQAGGQFHGGGGSGTYGFGGGGGWYGGGGSGGDGSGDDDAQAGGGSGHCSSKMTQTTLTVGGGAAAGGDGSITFHLEAKVIVPIPTYVTQAGAYHNPDLGLISISTDGENWVTISDKNVGASSSDVTADTSYGNVFQYGNTHGFPGDGDSTAFETSADIPDLTGYEGGNLYSNDKYRTNIDWNAANKKLWKPVAFANLLSLQKGPCDRGFHVPSAEEWTAVLNAILELEGEEAEFSYDLIARYLLMAHPKARKGDGDFYSSNTSIYFTNSYIENQNKINAFVMIGDEGDESGGLSAIDMNCGGYVRGFRDVAMIPTTEWTKIGGGSTVRLPLEYQEVEYIEGTGTQYINTGYIPNVNTEIETRLSWGSSQSEWAVFYGVTSNDKASDGILGRLYYASSTGNTRTYNWRFCNADYAETKIETTNDEFHDIKSKKNVCTLDGTEYTITTTGTPYQAAIFLFCGNNGGSAWRYAKCKMGDFVIKEGTEKKRHFVPCYRRIDGVIGLYDLVSNTFYSNAGSGTFIKGADVNVPELPKEYTEVEYLQSNGNQYIDTLINRNEILTPFIRYDFYSDTSTRDCGFLGYWGTGGYIFGESENQYRFTAGGTQGWTSSGISYSTGRHVFTTNASNWYLDGVQGGGNGGNMTIYTGTLHLFRAGGGFTVPSGNVRVYSFILGSSLTELLHYFVPCVRNQDLKPGFYDLITQQFYVNNGTGEFTYGGDMVRGYKNNEHTILYWPLSGASNDVSGFRNDGTAGGISYSLTDGVKAASFVSGSSNIYTDNSFVANCNGTQQFTYALWFKIGVMPASGKIYEFGWAGKTDYGKCDKLIRIASDGSLECYNYTSQSYSVIAPAGTVTTNTWYCIVYTYDGVKVKVYLNKELVGEVAAPGSYDYSSVGGGRFILGRIKGDTIGFQGYVGDVVIENIGRGEDWVDEYYSNTCSRYDERKGLSMRYIRNSMSGNNLNTSNHWVEIEAISGDTNVALGKTVTLVSGTFEANDINRIVDGNKVADNYYSTKNGAATIQIDLGQIYKIDEINMRHYFTDSRYYYSNNLQASPDGVNWITLFDSNITGTYNESSAGKTVLL